MLSCFDFIRDMDFLAVMCRLLLAMLCGGVIGIEREYKRRPAGFRTHILICLGASMTTLTSQYLFLTMHMFTDVGRNNRSCLRRGICRVCHICNGHGACGGAAAR